VHGCAIPRANSVRCRAARAGVAHAHHRGLARLFSTALLRPAQLATSRWVLLMGWMVTSGLGQVPGRDIVQAARRVRVTCVSACLRGADRSRASRANCGPAHQRLHQGCFAVSAVRCNFPRMAVVVVVGKFRDLHQPHSFLLFRSSPAHVQTRFFSGEILLLTPSPPPTCLLSCDEHAL
jgi:hypothetical protein